MKVLVLHSSTIIGGAEYSLLELLRKLENYPVELHLAVSDQLIFLQPGTRIHYHPIHLDYLKKTGKITVPTCIKFFSSAIKLFSLVRREKIEVVYCNTFRTLPYCLLIKWFLRVRIVCHCRDNLSSLRIFKWLYSIADEMIAVSKFIQKQIPANIKSNVVYNGVDPIVFQIASPTGMLHKKYKLPTDTILIGNIGQIVSWKNQWDFLSIAHLLIRRCTDIHFFVVGEIVDKKYSDLLKEYLTLLKLEKYVTFTGHVYPVSAYLNEFDMVIHTALNEPFGRVLIEAGAMGKPVIAYSSGGPLEISHDGLMCVRNVTQMAKHAFCLINNKLLIKTMGENIREHVIRRFNSDDYANKVYQILSHDKSIV